MFEQSWCWYSYLVIDHVRVVDSAAGCYRLVEIDRGRDMGTGRVRLPTEAWYFPMSNTSSGESDKTFRNNG